MRVKRTLLMEILFIALSFNVFILTDSFLGFSFYAFWVGLGIPSLVSEYRTAYPNTRRAIQLHMGLIRERDWERILSLSDTFIGACDEFISARKREREEADSPLEQTLLGKILLRDYIRMTVNRLVLKEVRRSRSLAIETLERVPEIARKSIRLGI